MIENLYIVIIIIGITALFVVLYYNKILKNLLEVLSTILKLHENRHADVQEYIHTLEKQLQTMGIRAIYYEIFYTHRTIKNLPVNKDSLLIKKNIFYKNINGELMLEVSNNQGENRVINKLILYVITLQIVNAIYTEIETLNESFTRVAKLQTYMMHDLKNVLQFFQMMQYNVENIQTEAEKTRFIENLQSSSGSVNIKVNKILALLQVESKMQSKERKKEILVHEMALEYLNKYQLPCELVGEAQLFIEEECLRTVFENILENISYKYHQDKSISCLIEIEEKPSTVEVMIQDSGECFVNPESVLQAFYTTKENGLGIGMYQVNSILEQSGASMECKNINNKPTTLLEFPKV